MSFEIVVRSRDSQVTDAIRDQIRVNLRGVFDNDEALLQAYESDDRDVWDRAEHLALQHAFATWATWPEDLTIEICK